MRRQMRQPRPQLTARQHGMHTCHVLARTSRAAILTLAFNKKRAAGVFTRLLKKVAPTLALNSGCTVARRLYRDVSTGVNCSAKPEKNKEDFNLRQLVDEIIKICVLFVVVGGAHQLI